MNIGDRIVFKKTSDPYLSLQPGTQGDVSSIQTFNNTKVIKILLDDGSTVKLIEGCDDFELVSECWLAKITRKINSTS